MTDLGKWQRLPSLKLDCASLGPGRRFNPSLAVKLGRVIARLATSPQGRQQLLPASLCDLAIARRSPCSSAARGIFIRSGMSFLATPILGKAGSPVTMNSLSECSSGSVSPSSSLLQSASVVATECSVFRATLKSPTRRCGSPNKGPRTQTTQTSDWGCQGSVRHRAVIMVAVIVAGLPKRHPRKLWPSSRTQNGLHKSGAGTPGEEKEKQVH